MHPVRVALAIVFLVPSLTLAQVEVKKSFDTQLFEPAIGSDTFFSVEGPWVADHLAFGVGLMMNYQRKPLVLYRHSKAGISKDFNLEEANEINVVENQMTANLLGFMGFHFKWLHAQGGLDLPINVLLMGKEINSDGVTDGDLSASGIGDLKLRLKVMILRDIAGFSLSFAPIITFPTGNDEGYGGDPNLSFRPLVIAGYKIGDFKAAVNLGAIIRESTLYFSSEISHQFLYGVGASYQVHDRVILLASLFGRAAFSTSSNCRRVLDPDTKKQVTVCDDSSGSDLDAYPLETNLGAQVGIMQGLKLTGGAGFGIIKAIGSPQVRVLIGVQWSPDFTDTDNDGIYDYADKCPTQPEDKDDFQDQDGCPELDNDGDLIPDRRDKCPNEKEDKDTFQDNDGCPDDDNDGDGIKDIQDACPFKPENKNGYKDNDGCPDVPDMDNDGIADSKDKCPKQPEDIDKFEDLDGCPDPDNDNDGVPDGYDDCPLKPEDIDKFKDDDGCPDLDNDGDGVLDAKDKCPNKPETINGYRDNDGCPDRGAPQVIIKKNKIVITKKVYFATARARIKRRSYSILRQVALTLRANPQIVGVRIEGHTDSRGKAKKNKILSQKRAEAVRSFLIREGIEPGRLFAVGYGPERPIETNRTHRGRAANRRVEFVILEK